MLEYSLENLSEQIHYGKTKEYFQEVLSSYHNGNYRSAVVMLWSVAVCDIVYKLQNLVDMYEDSVAREILDQLTEQQNNNPRSASWESKLIEETYKKTYLLDSSEYANLEFLQKKRHLSAHPILNANRELYTPNQENVRALIRNTLEDLLIKPPFYTKKIKDELLNDIAESAPALNTKNKLKTYLESKYLSKLKLEVELEIYKLLWKLVFRIENDENCVRNRNINFETLEVLSNRNHKNILEKMKGDKDYYSYVSPHPELLDLLVFYLSKFPEIYNILNEDAKLKIQHHIDNSNKGQIYGWFIKNDLEKHYEAILSVIEGKTHIKFTDEQLQDLLDISDTEEWQHLFCCILSKYYFASHNFNEADFRFEQAIEPYLDLFDQEAIKFLIEQIENNDQLYRRARGKNFYYHKKIKEKLFQLCGQEFDLSPYPNFKMNVENELY